MQQTARTSTKSANVVDCENSVEAVDCENSVNAVDCENSVYAVDCENSVYVVDSENSHKLGVCSGQRDLAQTRSMRHPARTSTKSLHLLSVGIKLF